MRYTEFISEKRKNPELNPKVPVNQVIKKYYDDTTDLIGEKLKNLFVSFTELSKLGINPTSTYKTPLGIYSYPAQYVLKSAGEERSMSGSLPFAGDQNYANIFKALGNVMIISDLNQNLEPLINKYYLEITKKILPMIGQDSNFLDMLIRNSRTNALVRNSAGGEFWYVTMEIAKVIARKKKTTTAIAWNYLFRSIGIDGIVDLGSGIIHENEPTQAVFFSINGIKLLDRVYNKYSPEVVQKKKETGSVVSSMTKIIQQYIKNGDYEGLAKYVLQQYNTQGMQILNKYPNVVDTMVKIEPRLLYSYIPYTFSRETILNVLTKNINLFSNFISHARYVNIMQLTAEDMLFLLETAKNQNVSLGNMAETTQYIMQRVMQLKKNSNETIPKIIKLLIEIEPSTVLDTIRWITGPDRDILRPLIQYAIDVATQKNDTVAANLIKKTAIYNNLMTYTVKQ